MSLWKEFIDMADRLNNLIYNHQDTRDEMIQKAQKQIKFNYEQVYIYNQAIEYLKEKGLHWQVSSKKKEIAHLLEQIEDYRKSIIMMSVQCKEKEIQEYRNDKKISLHNKPFELRDIDSLTEEEKEREIEFWFDNYE